MNPAALLSGLPTRLKPIAVPTTADLTLNKSHAGKLIVSNTAGNDITLPLLAAEIDGMMVTVIQSAPGATQATELRVMPSSADKVNEGTSGVGKANQSSADASGDSITLYADVTSDTWWVVNTQGTWANTT